MIIATPKTAEELTQLAEEIAHCILSVKIDDRRALFDAVAVELKLHGNNHTARLFNALGAQS